LDSKKPTRKAGQRPTLGREARCEEKTIVAKGGEEMFVNPQGQGHKKKSAEGI